MSSLIRRRVREAKLLRCGLALFDCGDAVTGDAGMVYDDVFSCNFRFNSNIQYVSARVGFIVAV